MKKFLIIIMSLVYCACLTPIIWYAILHFTAPEKVSSQTYEVGSQTVTTVDGNTISNYFCEINLFDDCYEMKFNYILDENATNFYHQGIQLVKNSDTWNFNGSYETEYSKFLRDKSTYSAGTLWWKVTGFSSFYDRVLTDKKYDNLSKYNYASSNNFETVTNDLNPIDLNSSFKLVLGEDIYLMKFNSDKAVKDINKVEMSKFYLNESEPVEYYGSNKKELYFDYYSNYRASDLSYFMELLFNSIKDLPKGTDQTILFQFGDLFDYYAYDSSTGTYLETTISSDKYAKVIADIKSYYAIKVKINEGNISSAKDSLFKHFKGSANYTTEEMVKTDYLYGNTLFILDENDFYINENQEFILNDEFVTENEKYINSVELKVVIDEVYYENLGAKFTKNSFRNFKVYKILTSTGKEVQYV